MSRQPLMSHNWIQPWNVLRMVCGRACGDAGRDFPLHCLGLVYFLLSDRCAWARHQASEDAVILIILANIMQPNHTNCTGRSTPYFRTLFALLAVSKPVDRGARKPDSKRRQRSRKKENTNVGKFRLIGWGSPRYPGNFLIGSNWRPNVFLDRQARAGTSGKRPNEKDKRGIVRSKPR